jgi:hypothetical protein
MGYDFGDLISEILEAGKCSSKSVFDRSVMFLSTPGPRPTIAEGETTISTSQPFGEDDTSNLAAGPRPY